MISQSIAIEEFTYSPPQTDTPLAKLSKSRIKRLQGLRYPQYRLRIDEMRVFYDIEGSTVEVLAITPKSKVMEWLKKAGEKI